MKKNIFILMYYSSYDQIKDRGSYVAQLNVLIGSFEV